MATPGAILKDIHRLRRHLQEIETRIAQAPKTQKIQQGKLAFQEDAYKKAQDEIKQIKVKIGEKELAIKTSSAQVKKYQQQTNDVTNKKEFEALKHEISASQDTIRKAEDEILELMGLVEEKTAQLPEAEKLVKKAKDELNNFDKDLAERMVRYKEEITKAKAELAVVEKDLPEEIRPMVNKLVSLKGVESFSGVEKRTCLACYTEVTPQMSNELLRGNFMYCKNCGRMLYAN